MKIHRITIILLLLFGFFAGAQEKATGVVFHDINGNGQKDQKEPGISGVMVSNQVDVVVTDQDGRYTLPVKDETIIFITKPSGYQVPLSRNNLPQFYYIHKSKGSPKLYYKGSDPTGPLPAQINFPLRKAVEKDKFTAIIFADPQPESTQEINYIRKDFVENLIGTDAVMGITLGDIMFDRLELWSYYNPLIAQIGIPFYNVIGNHDMNYDASSDRYSDETFERLFGPNYYSFEYGQVHFVALDNVYFYRNKNRTSYEGRIGRWQLKWLENNLSHVSKDKLVVLLMHIPLATTSSDSKKSKTLDRRKLFQLLKKYPYLLSMSGHTHTHEHMFLDKQYQWPEQKAHHHIVSVTVCGSWWSGPFDDRNVAIADQRDGVPNGYQILEFDGNSYKSSFRAAGKPANYQMRIHFPDGMLTAQQVNGTEVLVNVFDSSKRSKVSYRIDNGPYHPMKNVHVKDPFAVHLFDTPNTANKPWVKTIPSSQMWSAKLPNVEPGMHTFTVKTVDQYGREFRKSKVFYVW